MRVKKVRVINKGKVYQVVAFGHVGRGNQGVMGHLQCGSADLRATLRKTATWEQLGLDPKLTTGVQ